MTALRWPAFAVLAVLLLVAALPWPAGGAGPKGGDKAASRRGARSSLIDSIGGRHPLLARLAGHLVRSSVWMKKEGFPLDGSYCHVGAANAASFLGSQDIDYQIFLPSPYHTLVRFDLAGRRYYVDQTIAQFFHKGTPTHRLLLSRGGFFGTERDFFAFYHKHVDDALEWGDYRRGGYISMETARQAGRGDPYSAWLDTPDLKRVNSRKARTLRVIKSWYNDFRSEYSHDQGELLSSAVYYHYLFSTRIRIPE